MATSAGQPSSAGRALWPWWLVWLFTVVILVAMIAYAAGPLAKQQGWLATGGAATVAPPVINRLHPEPLQLGAGVIDPAREPSYQNADTAQLEQAMAATPPDLPGRYGGAVANLGGTTLQYDLAARTPLIPASTLKIMNAVAVLDALGGEHSFTTSVVTTTPGAVVLVGGGDPLLASTATSYPYAASIALPTTAELAAQTAAALQAQGVTSVSVGFDDSLFTGPVWHGDWPDADRTFVAPVGALVVDSGANSPGTGSAAAAAAKVFAGQLQASGIAVTGEPMAVSGSGGSQLAAVESVPVSLLVQEMLVHSDNFIAEMLLRQLALAKQLPASFAGGAAALTASLTELGLWIDGQQIADGSGLSTGNRLAPAALVAALQLAAARPDLSAVLAGLPVACATGTLAGRFTDARSVPARGQVRAKTGTLDMISGLAGYTPTTDGGLLAFAFIGNDLPRDRDVRGWFDHMGAALAGCDCVA